MTINLAMWYSEGMSSDLQPWLPRLRVNDATVASLRLERLADRLGALSRLCGESIELKCARTEQNRCESCHHCLAVAQLSRLDPPWTLGSLSQALMLAGQSRLSEGFYSAFFPRRATNREIVRGITQFRAY